jgi:hypothetical protein
MIIRCDGISGISPHSMTELPALLQPIATGMPTREPYSVELIRTRRLITVTGSSAAGAG